MFRRRRSFGRRRRSFRSRRRGRVSRGGRGFNRIGVRM